MATFIGPLMAPSLRKINTALQHGTTALWWSTLPSYIQIDKTHLRHHKVIPPPPQIWGPSKRLQPASFPGYRYQADALDGIIITSFTPSAGGQRRKECTLDFADTTYIIHNHQKFTSTIPKSSCTTNVTTSTQWYVGVHTVVHGETYDLIHMQVSICAPGPLWVKFFLI